MKDFITEISLSFVLSDTKDAQGSHRLEKYLNLEGSLEKKSALKSTGKALKSIEKSLISTVFCRS